MRYRILHIDNSGAVTGAYKALLSWCLSTPQFEHIWVLPKGSDIVADARKHFKVYELPFVEIGKKPGKLIRYLPALFMNGSRLRRIIKTEQPDLVHANDLYNLTPYAAGCGKGKKYPLVVHARLLSRLFPGFIYSFWKECHLKRANTIVAPSEAILEDWNRDPRVKVIYDPIDVTEKLPPYQFLKKPGEDFRFLYLANYIQGKGQDDALRAINLLREKGVKGFHVDFYGGTMNLDKNQVYKDGLRAYAQEHGLEAFVTFHEASSAVESVMKASHAVLHFSHSESFGMVCYEALYYGLPVISSDCGGPAEMMEPGKSGLLHPVGDTNAFAASMQRLMNEPDSCKSMSEQARQYVHKKFGGQTRGLEELMLACIQSAEST